MPSHHRPAGGFQNPWPTAERAGTAASLLRWLVVERLLHPRPADPDPAAAFPRAAPSFDAPRAAPGVVTATWVGHSTFLIQLGGWNVLTDPVWGERASPVAFAGPRRYTAPGVDFDALPPVDLVVLSHDHYDHLDAPTVRRLAARFPEARWAAPLGVGAELRALGAREVAERDWWEGLAAGPLDLACLPAQHFSGRSALGRDRTLWAGWALRARGGAADEAVYFAGDTGFFPEGAAVGRRAGPACLALLPVGAYAPRWFMRPVHCDPDDAVALYDAFAEGSGSRPALGGMHFGTFRLTDEPSDEPPRRARAAWARAAQRPAQRGAQRGDEPGAQRPAQRPVEPGAHQPAQRDPASLWLPRHGETWRRAAGAAAGAAAARERPGEQAG